VGTRFIYAFGVDLSLLLMYNLVFGMIQHYPGWLLMSHDFFIVSAIANLSLSCRPILPLARVLVFAGFLMMVCQRLM